MEGKEREGSLGSSLFGGDGVTSLGSTGADMGKLTWTFGRDIFGISNEGVCCFCCCCFGGDGDVGFFSPSGFLGNDNEGSESLASGGGRNDFLGAEGKDSIGGGLGISALGSDLTPNDSDNYTPNRVHQYY